ncbi:hypothetical protein G9A89_002224 [Geosiphon pyriformis]|nr:hypothetical protein G9A89_002224 [Geosiphon pyriformis]
MAAKIKGLKEMHPGFGLGCIVIPPFTFNKNVRDDLQTRFPCRVLPCKKKGVSGDFIELVKEWENLLEDMRQQDAPLHSGGVGKIDSCDIGRIIRLCKLWMTSTSKRNQFRTYDEGLRVYRLKFTERRSCSSLESLRYQIWRKNYARFFKQKKKIANIEKTVRKTPYCTYYRFRQLLFVKAEELGVRVVLQNEVYTSKTYN